MSELQQYFWGGAAFGAACVALVAAGVFMAYREWLVRWMTTPGKDVQVFDNGDGSYTSVVRVE